MKNSPRIKCRRYVTLLEVIIAMSLTLLILTTLTFFYRQIYMLGAELDVVQKKSFQLRFLENRFAYFLPRALSEKDKDFVFFTAPAEVGLTQSTSLIFTYDNEVDIDKPFANHVLGRLYVDPENHLVLAYWPSPKSWNGDPSPPLKKEVLMEGVSNIDFEFFIAPEKEFELPKLPEKDGEIPLEPEPKGEWRKGTWSIEYKQLPAMIRITLTLLGSEEKQTFVFPFPHTKRPITYDK